MKRPDPMTLAMYAAACAVGPTILVMAPAVIGSREPQAATAGTHAPKPGEKAAAVVLPEIAVDPDALAVHEASEAMARLSIDANPFVVTEEPIEIDEPVALIPSTVSPPELRLGTIVRGPYGVIATINGRPTAEGASLGDGWTLTRINHDERRIDLLHSSGERVSIVMDTPMRD